MSGQARVLAPPDVGGMGAEAGRAAELLRAMAHGERLRVLCLLSQGERSVGEINALVALSKSALSQHLARLREDGLVSVRRSGQQLLYSLQPGPAQALLQTLYRIYCPQAPSSQAPS